MSNSGATEMAANREDSTSKKASHTVDVEPEVIVKKRESAQNYRCTLRSLLKLFKELGPRIRADHVVFLKDTPFWVFINCIKEGVVDSCFDKQLSDSALRKHYKIPLIGSAHRALSDVHSLALVLQRLTYSLKLTIAGLVKESFKP